LVFLGYEELVRLEVSIPKGGGQVGFRVPEE
jgi:hypothetical protein